MKKSLKKLKLDAKSKLSRNITQRLLGLVIMLPMERLIATDIQQTAKLNHIQVSKS